MVHGYSKEACRSHLSSYVDGLHLDGMGSEHVGDADALLSYSWGERCNLSTLEKDVLFNLICAGIMTYSRVFVNGHEATGVTLKLFMCGSVHYALTR